MASQTTSIRLDDEKLARIDRLAAAIDRSRSWVMNQAIEQYLDHEEWFAEAVAEGAEAANHGDLVSHDGAVTAARDRIAKVPQGDR